MSKHQMDQFAPIVENAHHGLPQLVIKSSKHQKDKKSMEVRRPPWDGRFFVDGVTNLTEAHPYFKVNH